RVVAGVFGEIHERSSEMNDAASRRRGLVIARTASSGKLGYSWFCTGGDTAFLLPLREKVVASAASDRMRGPRGACFQEPRTRLADFVRSAPSPARGEGFIAHSKLMHRNSDQDPNNRCAGRCLH